MKLNWPDRWGLAALGAAVLVVLVIGAWTTYSPFGLITDLDVQRSMAMAAWAMVLLTIVSFTLGLITLAFLKWNLDEAKLVRAEAARSAKAAEEAVLASHRGS